MEITKLNVCCWLLAVLLCANIPSRLFLVNATIGHSKSLGLVQESRVLTCNETEESMKDDIVSLAKVQGGGRGTGALVDFYTKCGCIETAMGIFETCMDKKNFTWNAMLVGFAMHGHGDMLLSYFSKMVKNQVKPDGVTFLGVLVGCSHADLLSRAGLIKEALDMIKSMPMLGDVFVWGSLLGGCRLHQNVEVAEKAAEHIMEISPEDVGVYSMLSVGMT
ncbi:Pentatricopeptide repeat-containing protein [Artemisia annua]|uniref:Pentatricopeptide repeat-containing protein n=1 Tax=Artemisia annua TaxID=35608 RepID=A0A2U1KBY6_ARTAN|nr:Pentatricopeptide repeat-containing protein [Artemisia annua]